MSLAVDFGGGEPVDMYPHSSDGAAEPDGSFPGLPAGHVSSKGSHMEETGIRRKVLAEAESEQNLLLYTLLESCARNHVSQCSSEILEAFSMRANELAGAVEEGECGAWMFEVESPGGTGPAVLILPKVRSLTLETYVGHRQLIALAQVLGFSTTGICSCSRESRLAHFPTSTLFPELAVVRVRGRVAFNRRGSAQSAGAAAGGAISEVTEAYMMVMRAMAGLPELAEVDFTDSPIGPMLLRDIIKLIRETPSLVRVVLDGTLLGDSEKAMVDAQCERNALRLAQAEKGDDYRDTVERRKARWHAAMQIYATSVSSGGGGDAATRATPAVAHREHCPSYRTPYVARDCTRGEVQEVLTALYGSRRSAAAMEACSYAGADHDGASTHRPMSGSPLHDSRQPGSPSFRGDQRPSLSSSGGAGSSGDLPSEYEGEDSGEEELEGEPVGVNLNLVLPYLRYRLPQDDPLTLTRQSIEALKAVYANPSVATATFLGGRPVPSNIPVAPMDGAGSGSSSPFASAEERESLKMSLQKSSFLSAIRDSLFPKLTKPKSLFGEEMAALRFQTTAEEEYYATTAAQEEHWNIIVEKLLQFATPAYFTTTEGRAGGGAKCTIYEQGSAPRWLYFMPPDDDDEESSPERATITLTYREEQSTDGAAAPVRTTLPVTPGEFFGEVEVLGGTACHLDAPTFLAQDMTTRQLLDRPLNPQHLVAQLHGTREATAVVSTPAQQQSHGQAPPTTLRVWQFPMEVAQMLLKEPYQRLQRRAATDGLLEGIKAVPQSLRPLLSCQLRCARIARRQGRDNASVTYTVEDDTIGYGSDMMSFVYFLQEGQFALRTHTADGKSVERPLMPEVVVLSEELYAHDTEARERRAAEEAENGASPAMPNRAVGKEVFVREYREAKRSQRAQTTDVFVNGTHEGGNDDSGAASLQGPRITLSSSTGGTTDGVWRYCTLKAQQYLGLPVEVRLSLTRQCVSI